MTLTSSLNYCYNAIYITSFSLSIASNIILLRPCPKTSTRNAKALYGPQASTPVLRGEGALKSLLKLFTGNPGLSHSESSLYNFAKICQGFSILCNYLYMLTLALLSLRNFACLIQVPIYSSYKAFKINNSIKITA